MLLHALCCADQQAVLLDKQLRQLRQQHQDEAAALTAELHKARHAARLAGNGFGDEEIVNMHFEHGDLALSRRTKFWLQDIRNCC